MLDWLGDVGGLFDALRIIAEFVIAPISALALKLRLASLFVEDKKIEEKKSPSCLGNFFKMRRRGAKNKLARSQSFVEKELDLVRVIRRLKMMVVASLGTLTPEQRSLVAKMGKPVVTSIPKPPSDSSDCPQDQKMELEAALSRI